MLKWDSMKENAATLHSPVHRRRFLSDAACGLGSVALSWMLFREGRAAPAHHPARAKRAVHVFSPGGVSQVDTFDHKPELARLDGKKLEGKGPLDPFFGKPGVLRKSFYDFRQHGRAGAWVSSLFPHLATCVDDLTFFHAMTTKSSSHTPACFQMNTGFTQAGYPCLGAWLSYGLGSMNDELPTFVVLPDHRGLPNGGSNNWTNGFLPAHHQGTAFSVKPDAPPISNLATPASVPPEARRDALRALSSLNRDFSARHPHDDELDARIRAYELAARMQASIPQAVDFRDETAETQRLYGLDDARTAGFARNCLLARRLLERGVRFVQLFNGGALGSPRINWDAHEDVKQNHDAQGLLLDKPLAGLLKDLKRRGLLDDTLVVWSSEFGRTPFTEGEAGKGRDHHPQCFTAWMAGAGLKPGFRYGRSDEVGYAPAENATTVYDFHATALHLLGIDHERLTHYHNGIERRLTDVHGRVIAGVLA
jgi:hypothetical protein